MVLEFLRRWKSAQAVENKNGISEASRTLMIKSEGFLTAPEGGKGGWVAGSSLVLPWAILGPAFAKATANRPAGSGRRETRR